VYDSARRDGSDVQALCVRAEMLRLLVT